MQTETERHGSAQVFNLRRASCLPDSESSARRAGQSFATQRFDDHHSHSKDVRALINRSAGEDLGELERNSMMIEATAHAVFSNPNLQKNSLGASKWAVAWQD